MPVVISSRYRPNSAALSELPRATRTISLMSRALSDVPSLTSLPRSSAMVRSSAAGCSAISASINDIVRFRFALCVNLLRKNYEEQQSLATTLTRSLLFGLIVVCFGSAIKAQDRVAVIPQPRQLTANGERFPLAGAHVVLADRKSAEDRFAAEDFLADVKEEGISLRVRGGRDRKAISIGQIGSTTIQKALKAANVDVPASLNEEGYVLHEDAKGVVIAGGSAAGVFYGLQTLKQLVRGEGA